MHHLLLHRQITLLKQHNEKQRTNEPWAAPGKEEKQSKKKSEKGQTVSADLFFKLESINIYLTSCLA